MKRLVYILFAAAIMMSCKEEGEFIPGRGNDGTGPGTENNGGTIVPVDPGEVREVTPTMSLGSENENIAALRLKPGRLTGLASVTENNCNRAIKAGMCLDVLIGDDISFDSNGNVASGLEAKFQSASSALEKTKADLWGVHLPYKGNVAIDSKTASTLDKAYRNHVAIIELCLKYLKPKHLVIHPGNTSSYVGTADYEARFKSVQQSLVKIQARLDELNAQYGTKAVLCVENCARKVAFDAPSMLKLLSASGLEKTMICFDSGHAIVPLNGEYTNDDSSHSLKKTGDAVAMLKEMGTRVRTLHIHQNNGKKEGSSYDTHLTPSAGGLIDWGKFYEVLLKDCRYRGCFMYEATYQGVPEGEKSTIETIAANYKDFMYPEFVKHISK